MGISNVRVLGSNNRAISPTRDAEEKYNFASMTLFWVAANMILSVCFALCPVLTNYLEINATRHIYIHMYIYIYIYVLFVCRHRFLLHSIALRGIDFAFHGRDIVHHRLNIALHGANMLAQALNHTVHLGGHLSEAAIQGAEEMLKLNR